MKTAEKLQTLRSSQEFRTVYDRGAKFHTPFFSAFILKTNESDPRIGITVTRKIGQAVIRNRCKRRLRELARRHMIAVLGGVGCDIVINAKAGLQKADFTELDRAFTRILTRYRKIITN